MSKINQTVNGGSVFRVDKFVVPAGAREEILAKVRTTHELLRLQHGFVQDFLLEQFSGPGEFNLVTIVEWESQAAVDNVVPIVKDAHER
ncbi:antibiotic biosynthesis monooxygenase, partial [Mesorhizobium sp. M7A.F.Ca.CA.002.15.2.1]|uniref:antibiotic biosynthesis monooxygenase n=1 Tax=Mesorhizobium sp. M7A.F.Ca.CA.002.15.2.1 TaxID=2496678 RepID=UPI000FCBA54C